MSLHVGFELEGLCAGKNIVLRTHPTTTPVALFVDIVAWSSVHNIVVILVVI